LWLFFLAIKIYSIKYLKSPLIQKMKAFLLIHGEILIVKLLWKGMDVYGKEKYTAL